MGEQLHVRYKPEYPSYVHTIVDGVRFYNHHSTTLTNDSTSHGLSKPYRKLAVGVPPLEKEPQSGSGIP